MSEDSWPKWSMFVLKSIERIESAIKTIDETIDRFNLKIDSAISDLRKEFDGKIKSLNSEINSLKQEDKTISNLIHENKGKLAIFLILLPTAISTAIAFIIKLIG